MSFKMFAFYIEMVSIMNLCRVFQRTEFLFAVVKEDANQLLLGLRFSKDKVHLLYRGSTGIERLSFKRIRLADDHWHTIVISVSGHHATLTLDCGIPLEL